MALLPCEKPAKGLGCSLHMLSHNDTRQGRYAVQQAERAPTGLNVSEASHARGAKECYRAQVPPPSQRVLPWEKELEDGTIVSTIKEDSSGEGVLSLTLGTLGKLVLRGVTGVAKKMNLL